MTAQTLLPCVIALAAAVAATPTGAAGAEAREAPRVPARVISDAPGRVVFQVDLAGWDLAPSPALEGTERLSIPGFVRRGEPGQPQQPARKFLIGLPQRGSWTVSWRVVASERLGSVRLEPMPFPGARRDAELGVVAFERYELDSGIYNSFRNPALVEADDEAWIRRQRVLPLWVHPLTYDPATGEATLATSMEITVTFSGAERGRGAEGARPPVTETDEWETVFSRMLVNAGAARAWRTPRREPVDRSPRSGAAPGQDEAMVKLRVKRTGLHRVTADAVEAAGFPAGTTVSNLRLFKRGYDGDTFSGTETDVAFTVSEQPSGTAGVFDGGDMLVFYGLRLRDDDAHADRDELYADHNVYWLEVGVGRPMADRALTPGFLSADTSDAWFPVTRLFTDDRAFFEETKAPQTDYYFFNDGVEAEVDFQFELGWVRPSSAVSLTAKLHGGTYGVARSIETRLINRERDVVLTPSLAIANKDTVRYVAELPASSVVPGANTFHYERIDRPGNPTTVLLNWLEVSYQSLYRAYGNALRFNTATLAGDTSIAVTGLSSRDGLWLFDVTDPDAAVNCVLTPSLFTGVGDGWVLTFRDAIASRKEYVLAPVARMTEIQPGDVIADRPSAIIGSTHELGVDVLVISHRDFLADASGSDMHDWVRYRSAQGKRVLMVDVEDVFDEFNGGVPGTRGIDRFVRHFFELGNAGFLLLVGDGSEDHKQSYESSNPDFVPSHCRTEYVGSGFNEDEVVTLDKYYVRLPNPTGTIDQYPDLVTGRFPVGSMSELQRVLYKVFNFEKPKASDFWRRRMIIMADDGWGETGTESCWKGETGFETSQEYSAQVTESAQPGAFDVVRFFLSSYNNKYHTIQDPEQIPLNYCETQNSMYRLRNDTRLDGTLAFLDELSQGATLVTMQAHMNRSLVTHEWLFVTQSSTTPSGGGKDHLRCGNRDKPWIIFGMGCHFSDYAIHKEQARVIFNNPNGDAFAEQLLFQNNEGAVSTYGSAGFEYLNEVNDYMNRFSEIWFYESPYEDLVQQSQGRWVLGPMLFLVEAEMVGRGQGRPVDRYHILGDPLLRIDAGPPLIEVTVNGRPVQSGDDVTAGTDTISVVATVTDENAIDAFELWVDGENHSGTLELEALGDEGIDPARAYEVRFEHELRFYQYEIVLKALQAPDTTANQYHMAAEFVLRVPNDMDVKVNGRLLASGDLAPTRGDYEITLNLPTYVPSSEIAVKIDDEPVTGTTFSHPAPEDTTTWIVRFSKTLTAGRHEMTVTAGAVELPSFTLVVEQRVGLRNVLNYPNPFDDATQFLYSTDMEIDNGTIEVFTVSGKRIVKLDIPPHARNPGQNAVSWDGRDAVGDEIANGVYLYIIRVSQNGQDTMVRGKLARMK